MLLIKTDNMDEIRKWSLRRVNRGSVPRQDPEVDLEATSIPSDRRRRSDFGPDQESRRNRRRVENNSTINDVDMQATDPLSEHYGSVKSFKYITDLEFIGGQDWSLVEFSVIRYVGNAVDNKSLTKNSNRIWRPQSRRATGATGDKIEYVLTRDILVADSLSSVYVTNYVDGHWGQTRSRANATVLVPYADGKNVQIREVPARQFKSINYVKGEPNYPTVDYSLVDLKKTKVKRELD